MVNKIHSIGEQLLRENKHHIYANMTKEFYVKFINIKKRLRLEYNSYEKIKNLLEVSENEELLSEEYKCIKKLDRYESEIEKLSISIIIFSALTLESYIYDYGARKLGDNFMKNHLDKLDPISKVVIIVELVTKKKFPKEKRVYELIKNLNKSRNSLVHYKSSNKDLNNIVNGSDKSDDEFINFINKAEQAYQALEELANIIENFDPSENAKFALSMDV